MMPSDQENENEDDLQRIGLPSLEFMWRDVAARAMGEKELLQIEVKKLREENTNLKAAAAAFSQTYVDHRRDDQRPHSRGCGFKEHGHGVECCANCPTCGGKDLPVVPAPTSTHCHCGTLSYRSVHPEANLGPAYDAGFCHDCLYSRCDLPDVEIEGHWTGGDRDSRVD